MRSIALVSLALLVAGPVLAQNDFELPKIPRPTIQDQGAQGGSTDFQQILSGKVLQESLALKDLAADWKRVTILTANAASSGSNELTGRIMQAAMLSSVTKPGSRDDAMGAALGLSMLGGLFGGDREPVYYTRGQTVTVSGETFLVAYAPPKPGSTLAETLMQTRTGGKDPDITQLVAASKLKPDSRVELTLINTKSIASLGKIRPFSMDTEIAESAKPGASLIDWLVAQPPVPQRVPAAAVTIAKPPVAPTKDTRKRKSH